MGLLDQILSPQNSDANLALAAGLLQGNFAGGLLGMSQAQANKRKEQMAMEELAMKKGLLDAQIANYQSEADARMAKQREAQRIQSVIAQAEAQSRGMGGTGAINSALGEYGIGGLPAIPGKPIDYQSLAFKGVPKEFLQTLAESRNYGRDEVARTVDTVDAQGRPVTRQYTKFGDAVGGDAPQWKAPLTINQGDRTTLFDQVSMRPITSLQTNQSPDNAASVAATMRGQNMTDARQRDANLIAQVGKVTEASTGLRKEFEGLPEVKNYKQALPSYKSIEDAVKRNTPQSDINIVYGLAKLYDPTSVVREGEYATVANSPNIPERIKGYAQYLAGGGKLSPVTKAQILAEAQGRIKSYEDQYSSARNDFESISQRSGADKSLIFPKPMTPAVDPNALPPVPMKGMTRGGYRFKGGDPGDKNNWEKL